MQEALDLEEWRRPKNSDWPSFGTLGFLWQPQTVGYKKNWLVLGHFIQKKAIYAPEKNSEDVILSNLIFWNMFQFVDIDARNSQQLFFLGGAILKDGEVVHDLLGRNSLGPS